MVKKDKMTTDDLAAMMARRFDDVDGKITGLEFKIEDVERRLSAKIDHTDEKIDTLEQFSIRPLEKRISAVEDNIKHLNHKHG